jgi:hypothetical protein
MTHQLTIIVRPKAGRPGVYEGSVRLDGKRALVVTSRVPFLDACRALMRESIGPETVLVMRREGEDVDCLRGRIGPAAELTVRETGWGPKFGPWYDIARTEPGAPHSEVLPGEAA